MKMSFRLHASLVFYLLLFTLFISSHCNVIRNSKNELDNKNPSGTDNKFFSDYILIDDGGNEYEDYLENGDNDDDDDDDDVADEYYDTNGERRSDFPVNEKRDLIKGPSYTPKINDIIADNEIERENYDTEQMTSAGSKRKFIPDDESPGNVERFVSKKNYLHINTNTNTNDLQSTPSRAKTHDKTKRAFQSFTTANEIPFSKKAKVSEDSRKEREKAVVSEALINLLYDWKGKQPLSDNSSPADASFSDNSFSDTAPVDTHSFTLSPDGESGDSEVNTPKTKDEIEAARTISKLRQASHTFSDAAGKPAVATENDVRDSASNIDSDNNDSEDAGVEKEPSASQGESEDGAQKEDSRSISPHKSKGKISVMVNVNINERAARRSKVEGANKTVTQVNQQVSSGAGSGESDENEASGFLQKYGALKRLENNNLNSVDDISALTASTQTRETKPKEGDTSSGSGFSELNSFVGNFYNPPSLASFHPKNSTLNIFAGPAYPNNHEMKILNVAATAVPFTEEAEESEASEATSKDTVLESGSGEAEDDLSARAHTKKMNFHKPKNLKPLTVKMKSETKEGNILEVHQKPTQYENDETAEAEKGETPENIFANKMAADREEKNNELEHNDKTTESLTQIKLSQTKEFNKAQEAEINSNSKSHKKQDKSKSLLLHEGKEYKEKFSKEFPSETDDSDEDLSEAAKIAPAVDNKSEKSTSPYETFVNKTLKDTDSVKIKDSSKKPVKNETTSKESSEIKSDLTTAASTEDVNIEQVKDKQAPKSIPKEATVKKDTEDGGSSAPKVSQAPTAATLDNEEQSEETLSKNELKIDADNTVSSEAKDNVKKASNNDDKYETLEEVREKFKKWENHLKDKQSLNSERDQNKNNANDKQLSKASENEKAKSSEKVSVNSDLASALKHVSKTPKNENDVLGDDLKSKDEVKVMDKKTKDNVDAFPTNMPVESVSPKVNSKKLVTDEEKDKADQLKEIEEEKEEVVSKANSNTDKDTTKTSEKKSSEKDEQDKIKSWKEEEKILLARLKNPYLDENSKLKKYKEDEEDDTDDELKKIVKLKVAENKEKDSKTKEVPKPLSPQKVQKPKKPVAKKSKKSSKKTSTKLAKQAIGNIATTSKATDKEVSVAVDNMFANYKSAQSSKNLQYKSQVDRNKPQVKPAKVKKNDEKNLQQLAKFKNQILNEVAKIDNLELEYGKDSHSTKDLFEAKEVLQKDLKVVKELEKSLLKKQPTGKLKPNVNKDLSKEKKKHQVSPAVNVDLAKSVNALTGNANADLGIDKTPIDKLDSEEIIPEAKLGFDAESEEEKEAEREDEKKAEAEEEKFFKVTNDVVKSKEKTKPKAQDNSKPHSYEYAFYVGGKPSQEEEQKKKKKHPLEDIHALLKAEIKRLRERKKDRKSDAQLANIRKLVQQRLKSMLASGELDKNAFHSLAPDIKELGQLLKHRIKTEKKTMQKLKDSKKKKKKSKKVKKLKKGKSTGRKETKNIEQTREPTFNEEANVIESIQQIGNENHDQPDDSLKFEKPAQNQQNNEPNENAPAANTPEPEGVLPHLQGKSKEKLDMEMAKDMQELDNNLSSQDVFTKIEKSHPEQSNKMKTLLTTLNQKLGEIYSKASKAEKPIPAGPHMNHASPHQTPQTPHQPQQPVPAQQALPNIQRASQQPRPQQSPVTQQRQESPLPPPAQLQQPPVNVSNYQTQLAGDAGNELPGIYVPQSFAQQQVASPAPAAPAASAAAVAPPVAAASGLPTNPNMPGVTPINYPQQNAAQAVPNHAAGKVEAQGAYHLPPEGKNELPPPSNAQASNAQVSGPPMSTEVADDFDNEEVAPQKALADDEPVDTLVESLERDITEVWSYRDMFPDADSLGLDNEKVHNTYANLGSLSGLNLRRALKRALRGEDVGLAVVGGSISKGGPFSEKGLDYVLRSYFYAVEDYWNKIIRPVTGSSMIIRDVSIGGIATDYYSYCLQNHLPDDRLTNIVLWELSANDMRRYDDGLRPKPQPLEQFTRNVLSYRARPALIFVNFFALFDWDADLSTHCRNYEDEGEDDVSRYYKITSLSWRNMVCPLLRAGTQPLFTRSRLFAEDNFHPSILGHAQMSYIIIDYIRTEFLKNLVKMRNTFIADAVTRLQIPKSIYIPRPMYTQTYLWKPLCHTYMLVDNRSPNNTLPLDEDHSSNFRYTVVREFKIRSDKIVGMETKQKDQFLRYRMHVPRHQNGGLEPYKRLGIMTFTDDRQAQIQYDSENPKNLDSRKKFLEGTLMKYVAENVSPGEHELTIKSGSTGFLVCAIVLG